MEGECDEQSVQQSGQLEAALAEASLGDLVTVEVDGHGSMCLAARIDEASGGLLWEPLKIEVNPTDSKAPNSNVLAAHLRTKLWVAPMLRDTERNVKYAEAISRVVGSLPSRGDRLVLDVGTGTGLLAMLAAQAGAERVVACEMFPAVATMAKAIVEANQCMWPKSILQVLCLHSHDLEVGRTSRESEITQLPRRADLLVSELLDSTLLAEGLLPTVRDAWRRLLQPGARVVPAGCRVWAQVVQCSVLQQKTAGLAIPRTSENSSSVTLARTDSAQRCPFTAAVPVRLQSLEGFSALEQTGGDDSSEGKKDSDNYLALSAPFLALELDLSSESAMPPVEGCSRVLEIPAIASGQPHAVVYWFDMVLLREDETGPEVVYSTHPSTQSWQDHWLHASVALPGAPPAASVGEPLHLRVSHDDAALWFALLPSSSPDADTSRVDEKPPKRTRRERNVEDVDHDFGSRGGNCETTWVSGASKASCTCGLHLAHSVHRLQTLADPLRVAAWTTALDHALAQVQPAGKNVSALDVSDGSFLAMIAAARGARHIVSLEERDEACLIWSQITKHQFDSDKEGVHEDAEGGAANLAAENGDNMNRASASAEFSGDSSPAIEVLLARAEQIELPEGSLMNLILFDGCARGMEHRPCHAALHYWHLLRALQGRGVVNLPEGLSRSVPSAARIVGAAFTGKQVLASYGKVGHVCGFSHDVLDFALEEALGTSSWTSAGEPLHLALGEYSDMCELPGTRRNLLTLDYQNLTIEHGTSNDTAGDSLRSEVVVIDLPGDADVVAYWVELDLGPPGLMLPCGPSTRGFNQAVCLLKYTAPSNVPLPPSGLEHRPAGSAAKIRMECDLTGGRVRFSAKIDEGGGGGGVVSAKIDEGGGGGGGGGDDSWC